jgi:hypothetical protein
VSWRSPGCSGVGRMACKDFTSLRDGSCEEVRTLVSYLTGSGLGCMIR